ncbi:hypothetical protein [Streptomyces sp. NPDC021622]|uniref:hypothetical protein n=1 Tax=Streptomyces sp. NPDC021622 TaxID=3155013 RepID=UPI0033F76A70
MKIYLTRASVAAGDDHDAPHEDTRDLPAGMPLQEVVATVAKSGYLASIAEQITTSTGTAIVKADATWVLTSAGSAIAVVAQQWNEPLLLTHWDSELASLADGDGVVHWHFDYLCQQDPFAVYDELKGRAA